MPVRSYLILALATCLGATLGATASFGGEQSLLYPPEVRARPVVVVNGGGYQRHYWDPRYAALCPWTPVPWTPVPWTPVPWTPVAARRLARYQAPHETLCLR